MAKKSIYKFAFYVHDEKGRKHRLHQLRDGAAFSELTSIFYSHGYEYGGLLRNYPNPLRKPRKVEIQPFDSLDLIVMATRPPLHDYNNPKVKKVSDKKRILRSFNDLEERLFKVFDEYFQICSRKSIVLQEYWAEKLSQNGYGKYATIDFKANRRSSREIGASFSSLGGKKISAKEKHLTTAYLIYIPHAWDNGPGLFSSWGISGEITLIWNYLLRTKYWSELKQKWNWETPQFIIAEISLGEIELEKQMGLSFCDNWKCRFIL